MVKKTEIAWAAGFFDGEGCFSVSKDLSLRASIYQNDRRALDRFHQSVEGLGKVHGPYHTGTRKNPRHVWGTGQHDSVILVAHILWPYLGEVKKTQFLAKVNLLSDDYLAGRETLDLVNQMR